MHCFPIPFSLCGLMLSLALGAAAGAASAEEGALSQLYAARPPAGSSFVRVVNPSPARLQVRVAEGPVQRVGGDLPATSYAIVAGGRGFSVQVNGKPAASLEVKPNTFSTLVLRREGRRLRDLFGLGLVEKHLAWYLINGRLSAQRAQSVTAYIDRIIARLLPISSAGHAE